jgi:hypothetical protein
VEVLTLRGLVEIGNRVDATRTTKPLSAKEIEQLDRFLLADDDLEATMDVSTLDGFLCAVLSGPMLIMPSEWMRWVWDMEASEQAPEFTSEKQAQGIVSLLMRHANHGNCGSVTRNDSHGIIGIETASVRLEGESGERERV